MKLDTKIKVKDLNPEFEINVKKIMEIFKVDELKAAKLWLDMKIAEKEVVLGGQALVKTFFYLFATILCIKFIFN